MIPKFITSEQAIAGMDGIRERLAGATREKPWAEEYPEVMEDHVHLARTDTGAPSAFLPVLTAFALSYAHARDAKHLYATRGELLKHGTQDALARTCDAGDTLTLLLS